jgi:hypothetical protein
MLPLGGDFRKYIHALDLSCDSELLAGALLHTQDTGMAAHPALLAGGQFWRQNEN